MPDGPVREGSAKREGPDDLGEPGEGPLARLPARPRLPRGSAGAGGARHASPRPLLRGGRPGGGPPGARRGGPGRRPRLDPQPRQRHVALLPLLRRRGAARSSPSAATGRSSFSAAPASRSSPSRSWPRRAPTAASSARERRSFRTSSSGSRRESRSRGFRESSSRETACLSSPRIPASVGTPSRTLFDVSRYLTEGGAANVQTKRGCPFGCVYCTYPILEGSRVRTRPTADVVRELRTLVDEHGVDYVEFCDDIFNFPESAARELCEAMIAEGLRLSWSAFVNPGHLDARLLDLMVRAGCDAVELGTDSGSPAMLRSLGKSFTVEEVRRSSRLCHEAGVATAHYLLFGGPGENDETIAESVALMDELAPEAVIVMVGIRIYAGTELHEVALREGVVVGRAVPARAGLLPGGAAAAPDCGTGGRGGGPAPDLDRPRSRREHLRRRPGDAPEAAAAWSGLEGARPARELARPGAARGGDRQQRRAGVVLRPGQLTDRTIPSRVSVTG